MWTETYPSARTRMPTPSQPQLLWKSLAGLARFVDLVDTLLEEYSDVFNTELGVEPADLPPLDVEIDVKKWHCSKNQGHARNQSVEGRRRHIEKLMRLVLDYRALNECVGHMNWPLPNINHMIERLGARRPKKFAKFDMLKGF